MNNFFFFKSLREQNITSPLIGVRDAYRSYGSCKSTQRILNFVADVPVGTKGRGLGDTHRDNHLQMCLLLLDSLCRWQNPITKPDMIIRRDWLVTSSESIKILHIEVCPLSCSKLDTVKSLSG